MKVKNQIVLGKHNSYQYRYQFKMKHDTNIENISIYQNKVFFIIKSESITPIENKIDWKAKHEFSPPLWNTNKNDA